MLDLPNMVPYASYYDLLILGELWAYFGFLPVKWSKQSVFIRYKEQINSLLLYDRCLNAWLISFDSNCLLLLDINLQVIKSSCGYLSQPESYREQFKRGYLS